MTKKTNMKKSVLLLLLSMLIISGCKADTLPEVNNGISPDDIIKTIDKGKAVEISGKIITGDLDFTRTKSKVTFSSSHLITAIEVPVTFIDCIFMGRVTTNNTSDKAAVTTHFKSTLTFEACDFRANAEFDNMIVDGMANFTGAIFREKALFNNVTFKGRQTYFTAFTSEKFFSMQESFIGGAIDFFKGKTSGKLTFQSSDFVGNARFSDLDCNGKCELSLTNFKSDAYFTYANFGNDFRMANTTVWGKLDLISVQFQGNATLTNSTFCHSVNLSKSTVNGQFDLSGTIFTLGKPVMEEFTTGPAGTIITKGTQFATFKEFSEQ